MKYFTLFTLTVIVSLSCICQDQNEKHLDNYQPLDSSDLYTALNFDLSLGVGQGINQNYRDFLLDSMNLSYSGSLSFNFLMRIQSPITPGFSGFMGFSNNSYDFKSSDHELQKDIFSSYAGFGLGVWLKERVYIGGDIALGVFKSYTVFSKLNQANDIYESYINNDFSQIQFESKLYFYVGIHPNISIRINKNFDLFSSYHLCILNNNKIRGLNDIEIFSNISSINVGIRFKDLLNQSRGK